MRPFWQTFPDCHVTANPRSWRITDSRSQKNFKERRRKNFIKNWHKTQSLYATKNPWNRVCHCYKDL